MTLADVPDPLRLFLGDGPTQALVDYVEKAADRREARVLERVEDRFEKRLAVETGALRTQFGGLRMEFADLRTEFAGLRTEFADLRGEVRTDIAELRGEVRAEMGKLRGDIGDLRGEMGGLRGEFGGRFADLERQITNQTRWLIGLAAFIATAFKALDVLYR